MTRVGCYPGTFDPPTVAHLAVAEAARTAGALDRLDLVVSREALGKAAPTDEEMDRRLDLLHIAVADLDWLGVAVTEHRLIVDIAQGYDVVVMGADKWRQVNDPAWYGDDLRARDDALARLPPVLVAPRGDDEPAGVALLAVDPIHRTVNATAVRAGDADHHRWPPPVTGPPAT